MTNFQENAEYALFAISGDGNYYISDADISVQPIVNGKIEWSSEVLSIVTEEMEDNTTDFAALVYN